jgi:MSHA biogenesis protein MshM
VSVEPQKPQSTPGPPFIATAPALESLAMLDRGLGSREPFVLVTGETGVGKTVLVNEALRRWGGRVCVRHLSPSEATPETLFATLLGRFGGTENSQANATALTQRLLDAITHAGADGKVTVVVMDDAHAAAPELLLQLVTLADMVRKRECAFEVLLVGSPELATRLNDPELATLAAKVGAQVRLSPLTQHDTRHYLLQRGGHDAGASGAGMFSRKACRDIHGTTFGIPRAIEALAEEAARRAAKAGATIISPDHVRSATQSLRARRGNAPTTLIAPRAERMNIAPRPAKPAPAPAAAAANGTSNGHPRPEPPKQVASTPPPAKPPVASTAPAPKPAPAAPTPAKAQPVAPARPAVASAEVKPPDSSDQRVKDWVSRFGGSGGVRIGVGHSVPRYEESATLDVPVRGPAVRNRIAQDAPAEGEAKPATNRILIVDEEPPIPPELVARLNKLTKRRRRRGPSTTIQGAGLALAVMLLVVVLARQAGFGKRMGFDAADTSAHRASPPAPAPPPLTLGTGEEVDRSRARAKSGTRTTEEPKATERASRSKPKPTRVKISTSAPVAAETLPPAPNRVASTTPVQTTVPPVGSGETPEAPADSPHKFGIIAGSFPSNDMAKAEKDHLARLTSYRVWIDKTKVNGQRTYHLMVGRFETMERAWDAGQMLMRRGLIRDANVRPLTEREAR